MNVISKSGNLAPFVKATSQAVASAVKPLSSPAVVKSEKIPYTRPTATWNYSWKRIMPFKALSVKHGTPVTTQVRLAHTDLTVPDFSNYRRSGTVDPKSKNKASAANRKSFTYIIIGGGTIASTYAAKALVTEFVMSMSASADVLALAKIEVKLGDIPEGKNVTFKWRGKPLFIRHRSQSEIAQEEGVNVSSLRDPQHDKDRCQKPEWLVVIGVCTHLGCVPIANAGDFGGYYCPCHGSHYDASGRIRKGPAPLNLEVPPYVFESENLLVVG
ncbi:Rieske iron-sulfur protein [Lycorma delicatula]|uniref:Rieske iron-sulfur protein n=1 Tax=Lycorma delicatula TaxID=130591 RepID=UPI003F5179DA